MKNASVWWCDRNIVRSPIYYGLCTTEEMFKRELCRMDMEPAKWPSFLPSEQSDACAHFFECKGERKGNVCAIVCIQAGDHSGLEIAGLLVHEAVHIWQEIRSNIGEKSPSSEFEAYSIQSIAQNLMDAYVKQTAV